MQRTYKCYGELERDTCNISKILEKYEILRCGEKDGENNCR